MGQSDRMNDFHLLKEGGVSIVLGTYNRIQFLKGTIESIRAEQDRCPFPCEIIVVDGGSTDGTIAWLAKQKDLILLLQHNRGAWRGMPIARRTWGYFMNLGFKSACGKYVCMLSDDCLLVPSSLKNGFDYFESMAAQQRKVGSVAFYWRNWPGDKNYFVGITLGNTILLNHGLYSRRALEEVGFIDEETYKFYCADGDLCLRLRRHGYECMDSKSSFVEHFGHANPHARSENQKNAEEDWNAYLRKWKGIYEQSSTEDNRIERSYEDKDRTYRGFPRAVRRQAFLAAHSISFAGFRSRVGRLFRGRRSAE